MNTGIVLSALAFVSVLVSLTVEGIKKLLDEQGKTYKPNLLAAIVAVVLSIATMICYVLYFNVAFSIQVAVITVCFAFLSWLCALVGYDKVSQLIKQIFSNKEGK
jgi:hypothetical protein